MRIAYGNTSAILGQRWRLHKSRCPHKSPEHMRIANAFFAEELFPNAHVIVPLLPQARSFASELNGGSSASQWNVNWESQPIWALIEMHVRGFGLHFEAVIGEFLPS